MTLNSFRSPLLIIPAGCIIERIIARRWPSPSTASFSVITLPRRCNGFCIIVRHRDIIRLLFHRVNVSAARSVLLSVGWLHFRGAIIQDVSLRVVQYWKGYFFFMYFFFYIWFQFLYLKYKKFIIKGDYKSFVRCMLI